MDALKENERVEDLRVATNSVEREKAASAAGRRLLALASLLVVPVLYTIGVSRWEAWLDAQGLPTTPFKLSVDEALLQGYFALVYPLLAIVNFLPTEAQILVTFVALWAMAALLLGRRSRGMFALAGKRIVAMVDWVLNRLRGLKWLRPHAELAAVSYGVASIPMLVLGVLVCVLMLLILPAAVGTAIGKHYGNKALLENKTRWASHQYKSGDQLLVLDGEHAAFLITCGSQGCGAISESGKVMMYPWDRINRIESTDP